MGTKRPELQKVQTYLSENKISAFLIPRADVHQGEYVSAREERLAWVSGFKGSAGMACVTPTTAALFVDGRYTLQADYEAPDFERHDLTHSAIAAWVGKGVQVAFDPWLFTPGQIESLASYGLTLVPVCPNPIDAVWRDQPTAPQDPAVLHDLSFTGKTSEDKIKDMATKLLNQDIDAAVITLADSLCWLLNIRGNDVPFTPFAMGFAVLWAKDCCVDLFMDGTKLSPDVRKSLKNVRSFAEKEAFESYLTSFSHQSLRVLVDPQTAPMKVKMLLSEGEVTVVQKPDPILLAKACKNTVEVEGAHAAHLRDGVALTKFLAWLDKTAAFSAVTEIEAADKLEVYRRQGVHFKDLSFPTISATGDHGAIMHYRVSPETNKVLEKDTLYLVDSGGQYLDGTTDVTRTVSIGKPSLAHITHFTAVLKGHIALATARFPVGTSGHQLDALARLPLWQMGVDFAHGTGHGVGSYLSVHEGPQRIAKAGSSIPLAPGMILSNEPGYYRPGAFGIRIENLVVVRDDTHPNDEQPMLAFDTLTLAPYDRRLIDLNLLSPAEQAWVNFYHKHVFDKLCTHLDDETTDWLRLATLPL